MYRYLALGDSYTVGEGVALFDSFPYKLVHLLRQKQIAIAAPEIIARTGFTTSELLNQISGSALLPPYHLVTVLAGVNNQYRGQDINVFREEFKRLLDLSLNFAGGMQNHVYVLSIPDWGLSPFAATRNQQAITTEISGYNGIVKTLSEEFGCSFLDITGSFIQDQPGQELWAADGLHPSAIEYLRWATLLYNHIHEQNIF